MKLKFPENFLWGAATSAHQVEGGNTWNDWYQFEQAGQIRKKEVSGIACDHYNRYREDFDIAKKLNQNAQRISLEWSRIEKEKGVFDQKEIEHYKNVLKHLKKNGFTTFVTLHHFTNPIWFAKEGGWANPKSINYFNRYAQKTFTELHGLVDFWATFNEPLTPMLSLGYLTGQWPPQQQNPFLFLKAALNTVRAHNLFYTTIKFRKSKAKIGIVYNTQLKRNRGLFLNFLRNSVYLHAVKKNLDFFGLNYYFPLGEAGEVSAKTTDMGWPIYPKGLYDAILYSWKLLGKPIYITENGIADATDKKRKAYITEHLKQMHRAINSGAKVLGYFYWSLLDNFEWTEGFEPRFGLVEVDYKTQKKNS